MHTPPDESVLNELRLNLAEVLIDLGRYERAEPLLLGVRDFLAGHAGSDPAESSETLAALGELHLLTGHLDMAEREERQALATLTEAHMDFTAPANVRLCRIQLARGQIETALQTGREARDNSVKIAGERSHDTASAHFAYAEALAAADKDAAAEGEFRAALRAYTLLLPPDGLHLRSASVRLTLAQLLAKRERGSAESVQLVTQAIALRTQIFGETDSRTVAARALLTKVQTAP
jgi:predicted negative regulator of RcsB-dependent stress response